MKQIAIKYGIITGAAIVLYLLLFYSIDKSFLFNPLVFWASLLIPLIGMVVATRKVRDSQDEGMTKKDAITTSFITWVIAMALFHLFLYILFNFIDNGLIDIQKELAEKATGETFKREDLEMTVSLLTFRAAFMMIPGFLFSYMIASFLSNK